MTGLIFIQVIRNKNDVAKSILFVVIRYAIIVFMPHFLRVVGVVNSPKVGAYTSCGHISCFILDKILV